MDCIVHGILQARILKWIAIPFSRESSQPRDRIQVSHITGEFFTNWATKEAKNTGEGSLSLLQGSSHPRNWTEASSLQVESLPAELPGKPYLLYPIELKKNKTLHWDK